MAVKHLLLTVDAATAVDAGDIPPGTTSMIAQAVGGDVHFSEESGNDPTSDTDDSTPDGIGSLIPAKGSFEFAKGFGQVKFIRRLAAETVRVRIRLETGDAP